VEEADLAEHRTDAAHLEHHPLDRLVATCRIGGNELAGLVGEIEQDRARLEQRQRPAAGAARVEDRRDLLVRVERCELGRLLLVAIEGDAVRLVGEADLLDAIDAPSRSASAAARAGVGGMARRPCG
jgi:hypothetical protein